MLIKDYHIGKRIYSDIIGELFVASTSDLDRAVVCKILHEDLSKDEELVLAFHKAAKAGCVLKGDHFLKIVDHGVEQLRHYLIYENFNLTPLEIILENRCPLPILDATAFMEKLAVALRIAHIEGMFHGFLSPQHIFVDENLTTIKLANFGFHEFAYHLVQKHHAGLVQSIPYLADEFLKGGHVTRQSDIFSLGVLFYQLLIGEVPHGNQKIDDGLQNQRSVIPPSLHRLEIPEFLDTLILEALETEPRKRTQNLSQFIKNLIEAKSDILATYTPTTEIVMEYLQAEEANAPATGASDQKTERPSENSPIITNARFQEEPLDATETSKTSAPEVTQEEKQTATPAGNSVAQGNAQPDEAKPVDTSDTEPETSPAEPAPKYESAPGTDPPEEIADSETLIPEADNNSGETTQSAAEPDATDSDAEETSWENSNSQDLHGEETVKEKLDHAPISEPSGVVDAEPVRESETCSIQLSDYELATPLYLRATHVVIASANPNVKTPPPANPSPPAAVKPIPRDSENTGKPAPKNGLGSGGAQSEKAQTPPTRAERNGTSPPPEQNLDTIQNIKKAAVVDGQTNGANNIVHQPPALQDNGHFHHLLENRTLKNKLFSGKRNSGSKKATAFKEYEDFFEEDSVRPLNLYPGNYKGRTLWSAIKAGLAVFASATLIYLVAALVFDFVLPWPLNGLKQQPLVENVRSSMRSALGDNAASRSEDDGGAESVTKGSSDENGSLVITDFEHELNRTLSTGTAAKTSPDPPDPAPAGAREHLIAGKTLDNPPKQRKPARVLIPGPAQNAVSRNTRLILNVFADGTPTVADIYVNGVFYGQSAADGKIVLQNLSPGATHLIAVEKKGYDIFAKQVSFGDRKTLALNANLFRLERPVQKENTRLASKNPSPVPPKQRRAEAKGGPPSPVDSKPEEHAAGTISVQISSAQNLSDVYVYVNGSLWDGEDNIAPADLTLPAGSYVIEVKKEGYVAAPLSYSIDLMSGDRKNLTFILLPN